MKIDCPFCVLDPNDDSIIKCISQFINLFKLNNFDIDNEIVTRLLNFSDVTDFFCF